MEFDGSPGTLTPESIELEPKGTLKTNECFELDKHKKTHVRTGSDFWNQVSEKIDNVRSSQNVPQLADKKSEAVSTSTPSLGVPSSRPLQQHRFSVRDAKRNAKLARFYSQDQNNTELKVLQAQSNDSKTSLAAIWAAVDNQNKPAPKRKLSSWEESVSLQRRRSLAARDLVKKGQPPIPLPIQSLAGLDTKDLRYCFQHPYLRLFTTMTVIFCNFLLFAEDPISHSYTESVIPMVGNVFSFVCTKYPPDWRWALIKVLMWILAILCGLVIGKVVIHITLFGKCLRLKMFRDEQGSWIAMFLTVIFSLYIFSHIYNFTLYLFYKKPEYMIDSRMGVSNSTIMKAAACGTWLGDLITWLIVTDVMLQDSLYPDWAPALRKIWRKSNIPRILIFWVGSALGTALVVTLIVSDMISWDTLNQDFVASTELSRAFLASFILVLDLVIMMQDWDFPHFTTTVHINLPGFSVSTLEWKYAEVNVTGKWFSYGVIFMVMMLDLNMWKNQIFYEPSKFGQYVGPENKIHTVLDPVILQIGNASLWKWEERSKINKSTNLPYTESDMKMNSRYMDYHIILKCCAFIPSILTLSMFLWIIYLYGRFPHKEKTVRNTNEDDESDNGGISV